MRMRMRMRQRCHTRDASTDTPTPRERAYAPPRAACTTVTSGGLVGRVTKLTTTGEVTWSFSSGLAVVREAGARGCECECDTCITHARRHRRCARCPHSSAAACGVPHSANRQGLVERSFRASWGKGKRRKDWGRRRKRTRRGAPSALDIVTRRRCCGGGVECGCSGCAAAFGDGLSGACRGRDKLGGSVSAKMT